MVAQLPGGALIDATSWKRGMAIIGIAMIGTAALILALAPSTPMVFAAETLHGITAGNHSPPAIAAISLGLIG